MKITAGKYAIRVDYRVPGKVYGLNSEGVAPFNNDKETTDPFDSKDVAVGGTFDTEGVHFVKVVEYTPTPDSTDSPYVA